MRRSPLVRRALALAGIALALAACGRPTAQAPAAASATAAPTPAPSATRAAAPTPATPTTRAATSATPPPAPGAARISFAPGATSATVGGAVVSGTRDYYVLRATAGQAMAVTISAIEQNGVFTIYGPDGNPLAGTEPGTDATSWQGRLPADGDYTFEVGPTRANASYELTVSIAAPPFGAIRATDWAAALAADPALSHGVDGDPAYVAVGGSDPAVQGRPLLDSVVYVDIDGDGGEEAAIPLSSGGTAGNVGLLVYRATAGAPALAGWMGGYKIGLAAGPGQLIVRQPLYAAGDANCCPSGLNLAGYTLGGQGLALAEQRDEGLGDAQPALVRSFYDLLGRGELRAAYALLSAAQQAASPYEAWAAGYADTVAIAASAEADPGQPNSVRVTISATDRDAAGGQVARRFSGTWRLVWDSGRPGWALDAPQIRPAP